MATFDYGHGCPCGLSRICHCGKEGPTPTVAKPPPNPPRSLATEVSDDKLLERAVRYAIRLKRRGKPNFSAIMHAFALGSTFAGQLCLRYGIDPDDTQKEAA